MNWNSTLHAMSATAALMIAMAAIGATTADASSNRCVRKEEDQLSDLGSIVNAHLTYKRANVKAVRRPAGVRVNFVPAKGMNVPLLLRQALCEAERASDQHPLAVEGIKLRVKELGPHFALFIDTPSVASAREVLQRIYAQYPAADRPVVYSHRRHHSFARNPKRMAHVRAQRTNM